MGDLKRIEIVRIKDIPEVHTVEVSYVENYEDAIRMPPGAWKDKLYPKILEGIDKCLKITCEKDRQTNNWIYTAKMHMIHPDELFLTVGRDAMKADLKHDIEELPSAQQWVSVSERLPSYGEDVLLSIGRYVNVGYLVQVSDDEGQYNWFYSGWYHPLSEVDAWLPLPEPYRGDSDA